nr:hypothetical protein [uncultured Roseovarius sp.]
MGEGECSHVIALHYQVAEAYMSVNRCHLKLMEGVCIAVIYVAIREQAIATRLT